MRHRERRTGWWFHLDSYRVAVVVTALAGGCSVTTNEEPRQGACTPFQLGSLTPDCASDVRTDTKFGYSFTDFPDPDSAINANFGVVSGPYYYTAHEAADLSGRAIVFKPTASLPAGLGFTLAMSGRISSLRGCPLTPPPPDLPGGKPAGSYYFAIHTVEPNVDLPAEPPAPPAATFSQVLDVMAQHCAGAGCHLDAAGGCLPAPGGGLSLCAAQAFDALVSVPSRQVSRLAIVVPRDSSRSYVLRKLLAAPPVAGHQGPPDDSLPEDELRDGGVQAQDGLLQLDQGGAILLDRLRLRVGDEPGIVQLALEIVAIRGPCLALLLQLGQLGGTIH